MSVGNKWTFMNSTTHSPAVITIQPSPVTFGCAQSPVPVTIYKLDPNNYWSPTFQADLTWFLGIRPNLDLIGFGHLWNDFSGNPVYGTNFYITQPGYDPDANPQYILMRAGGPNATAPLITQQYFGNALNPDYNCETPPPPPYSSSGTWQANWSSTSVSTPGYAGTAMVATYGESNVSAHETWYYAQNIGPVQIVNTAGLTLQLVEHSTGAVSPKVAFRDILITQAAATAGLNFDQWNYYLAQVTHIAVPAPQEVCMDPSLRGNPLTVDQYLSYLTNRGTSCSSVHWNMTELQDVQNRAGVTDGLTYDQWNYYDSQAGYAAYDVTQVCMRSETYCDHQGGTSQSTCDPDQNNVPQGTINTIFPNRYATYSSAQWFSLVGYVRAGGVCQ